MSWALIALFALLIAALACVCARSLRTLARVEEMLDRAVEGGFSCEHYDETRLSRLEARMARYLSAGGAAREALSRERDELQSLVSDVAHQARLPASNLLLYSQLLSEAPELSGRSRELAAQLEGQAEKLRFLMEALVKVSRLESGIIALRPRAQGVSRLLQALDFGLAAAQKGVRLEIADAAEISARYDLKWTLEALSNLVDNAVKYTPPAGKCGSPRTPTSCSRASMCATAAPDSPRTRARSCSRASIARPGRRSSRDWVWACTSRGRSPRARAATSAQSPRRGRARPSRSFCPDRFE